MQQIGRLYQKYPIIVTSVVAFLARFLVTVIVLVPVYYVVGDEAYTFLYIPVLCGTYCCTLFALRPAILIHIRRHKQTTGKGQFYRTCYYVVSFGFYLFLLTTVVAIFGFA